VRQLLDLAMLYSIQYTVKDGEVSIDITYRGNIIHTNCTLPQEIDQKDIEIATLECIKQFYGEINEMR
jgi:hypothetical protein